MSEKKVLVFSTPTWATCKSAKDFLAAKGVPFTNKDIAEDESAMKELEEKVPGATSTPIILVDDEVIVGFDRTKLQKALGLQWNYLAAADSKTLRSPIRRRTDIRSTAWIERGRPWGSVGTQIVLWSCPEPVARSRGKRFSSRRIPLPILKRLSPAGTVTGQRSNSAHGRSSEPSRKESVVMKNLDLKQLQDAFNRSSDSVRILAILSPTWSLCTYGHGIVRGIFEETDAHNLKGFETWLPMMKGDRAFTLSML